MAVHFDKGDLVRLTATFENAAGTDIDPTAVLFSFINPAGTSTTYTYGTDVELVKSATGIYYVDINASSSGVYRWRWYSTGTGQTAAEGSFTVEQSWF